MAVQPVGNQARQIIGTMVTAQKRHDRLAILGECNHRRLGALVCESRCEKADQRTGRHDGDDGTACVKEFTHMRLGIWEYQVSAADPCLGAMHLTVNQRRNLRGQQQGSLGQNENGRFVQVDHAVSVLSAPKA